jgi:hypothetical protein
MVSPETKTEAALGVWEDPHGELTYSRAPNYERFADRPTPEWFNDAKLGIFIHWGLVVKIDSMTNEIEHMPSLHGLKRSVNPETSHKRSSESAAKYLIVGLI